MNTAWQGELGFQGYEKKSLSSETIFFSYLPGNISLTWKILCVFRYSEVLSNDDAVVRYVTMLLHVFGLMDEDPGDGVAALQSRMVELSEERINEISEKTELQAARKEVSQEMRSRHVFLFHLAEYFTYVEVSCERN